ncbi:RNA pyrophosphohydrolase [Gluconobacter kanchanaburiensis]|uniref:RNA pyrophosphohydrolase n=1 Tax=Gluconobacter kanchanaburiensis NBRC 103587 TaxID=1307948 RepID=A0A511B7W5_9PROT|nr:RNA pyrophosphohydrolase [Gluconobacter kanchanaburiensis]MBF0861411.1 RNA pyrophosphohydrolase [Gluconobacter kanchanaburiensis]GBR68242.1 dinucleoside polyphosphate hydrolase [Gluconobacter kanchanaburiensis NBRC 103587]GEK95773.1 RNA pyrophosphohydrolase [Gluconobacter kanchanaburiensis NBRC 103587]
MIDSQSLPYRPNVGIALFNREGKLFIARRHDLPGGIWQCPQGGIDDDEAPQTAALREMGEEIGTQNACILAERAEWLSYDLPQQLIGKALGGRFRGQTQKWFVMGYEGEDADIRLDVHEPAEFDAWEWVEPNALLERNLGFKKALYANLIPELAGLFQAAAKDWVRTSRA